MKRNPERAADPELAELRGQVSTGPHLLSCVCTPCRIRREADRLAEINPDYHRALQGWMSYKGL